MHVLIVDAWETAWGVHVRGIIEEVRAGDGARTRDSLLGRQAVEFSPLARSTSALQPVSYDIHAM